MMLTAVRPALRRHPVDDSTRRGFLAGGAAAGVTLLVGCGADGRTGIGVGGNEGTAAGFPVEISHRYGTTRIGSRPQRVVSVGDTDQDPILALGVVPVGIRDFFGEQPYATWPWARALLGEATPTVLEAGDLSVEGVAALEPDLIIGTYSALSRREYDLLSRIAPTVAQSADYPDFGQPWDEITLTVGRALGREERARELVDGVTATLARTRRDHPELAGRRAVVGSTSGSDHYAFTSTDNASRFLTALGCEIAPEVDALAADLDATGVVSVSEERLDLFDQDLAVWYESLAEAQGLLDNQLYAGSDVHAEGRDVFLGYEPLGGALSFSTVLSLPFAVERIVPLLVAAVDGDPDTAAAPTRR